MLESFTIKLEACNFIKKRIQLGCFPVNTAKFSRLLFFYRTPPVVAFDKNKYSTAVYKTVYKLLPHYRGSLCQGFIQPFFLTTVFAFKTQFLRPMIIEQRSVARWKCSLGSKGLCAGKLHLDTLQISTVLVSIH